MINTLAGLLAALTETPKTVRCEGWVTFQAENSGLIARHRTKDGIQWSLTAAGKAQQALTVGPVDIEALKAKQKAEAKKAEAHAEAPKKKK
jgi:phosphoribosylaminoimidazole carboxylase (NCAIR synthetase)